MTRFFRALALDLLVATVVGVVLTVVLERAFHASMSIPRAIAWAYLGALAGRLLTRITQNKQGGAGTAARSVGRVDKPTD